MPETKAAKPAAVSTPPEPPAPPLPPVPVIPEAPPEPPPPPWQPLEDGLRQIIEHKNTHYANAFLGRTGDQFAVTVTRDEFLAILDRVGILPPARNLPDRFQVTVKFSPIALFKKWIFTLSNKDFLKVSERAKEFVRDFYVFTHQDYVTFQALTTNIAHEKYLVTVFDRKYIPEPIRTRENASPESETEKKATGDWTTEFRTTFTEEKKLVVYKDYLNRKASSVELHQSLVPGRLYDVKISVIKDPKTARFRVTVGHGHPITHQIKFSGKKKATALKPKAPAPRPPLPPPPPPAPTLRPTVPVSAAIPHTPPPAAPVAKPPAPKPAPAFRGSDDFRKEVLEIIKKVHNTKKKTNKFANISLGRVNKIPILINLPTKYKDLPIRLHFNKNLELLVFDPKEIEIRTYTVAKSPKSNWLEKKA